MKTTGRPIRSATLLAFVLSVVPMQADASELNAGINFGWLQAGTATRLAVSPHAGISWRIKNDLLLGLRDLLSVVPPIQIGGAGIYNSIILAVGYSWENGDLSAGPSVAVYFMPACGRALCGHVAGVAAGAHAQANRATRRVLSASGCPYEARLGE